MLDLAEQSPSTQKPRSARARKKESPVGGHVLQASSSPFNLTSTRTMFAAKRALKPAAAFGAAAAFRQVRGSVSLRFVTRTTRTVPADWIDRPTVAEE